MIVHPTSLVKDLCNPLELNLQKLYDDFISSIDIYNIECGYCHDHCMVVHGYYYRSVKLPSGKLSIRILRVRCKHCNHTHAIFTSDFVPYSQILLTDVLKIITASSPAHYKKIMEDNCFIDESDIYRTKKIYLRFWEDKISSIDISLNDTALSEICIRTFHLQFMQIKPAMISSYSCFHIRQQELNLFS